ncbi:AHH domain-containing protein [Dyella sp.]|uniref:AHH domain-containing protein n=1 Tax=Dyella sp. TaxID=1869338 RepID=UPI002B4625C8|nr:AHH domain-containing protein [Dyella sp.]HKT28819.1 AHH domain-containing protein [Dyella sp.]
MAKQASGTKVDPFKKFGSHAEDMRIALNQIDPSLAYKVGNMQWLNEMKEGIRYGNGETISPLTEKMFLVAAMAELVTTTEPSARLATNMSAARDPKPDGETEAHHIVAFKAKAARLSRLILFGWKIAINDRDNGVHLPAFKRSVVASLPDARKHRPIHTSVYHMAVFQRLQAQVKTKGLDTQAGREALRVIKEKILNGTFPYLREHLR